MGSDLAQVVVYFLDSGGSEYAGGWVTGSITKAMSLPHIGALKAVWLVGVAVSAAFAVLDPTWRTAIVAGAIVSIPPTITGLFGIINQRVAIRNQRADAARTHTLLEEVKTETNSTNEELRKQRNAATTRADIAEGHAAGIIAEQDRTKGT